MGFAGYPQPPGMWSDAAGAGSMLCALCLVPRLYSLLQLDDVTTWLMLVVIMGVLVVRKTRGGKVTTDGGVAAAAARTPSTPTAPPTTPAVNNAHRVCHHAQHHHACVVAREYGGKHMHEVCAALLPCVLRALVGEQVLLQMHDKESLLVVCRNGHVRGNVYCGGLVLDVRLCDARAARKVCDEVVGEARLGKRFKDVVVEGGGQSAA